MEKSVENSSRPPISGGGIEMGGCMMFHNPASKNLSVDERALRATALTLGCDPSREPQARIKNSDKRQASSGGYDHYGYESFVWRPTAPCQREENLREAGFSLRAGLCDLRSLLRQGHRRHRKLVSYEQEIMSVAENVIVDPADALKCDLASEVLRSFGGVRFAATGWSMLPALWPGDLLLVETVPSDQVRVGDIALVGRAGKFCAHRVVSRTDDSGDARWITRGDAMPAPDLPVTEAELLGRVTSVIRDGRVVAVPVKLNVIEKLMAKIVQRSFFAACVVVYLHRMRRSREESVLLCRG